jgi:GNAT superfamily N-acetyltransferase
MFEGSVVDSVASFAGAEPLVATMAHAVKHLKLEHALAPETRKSKGWIPGHTSQGEALYSMLSPRKTGLSAAELELLFTRDQDSKQVAAAFSNAYFAQEASAKGHLVDLYASDLSFGGVFDAERGIKKSVRQASYVHIARDEEGQLVGFVAFSVKVVPQSTSFAEEGFELTEMPEEAERSVYLDVDLDLIYTRKAFRGRGAGWAMLDSIAHVVSAEVGAISKQIAPVARHHGVQLRIEPALRSEWHSWTGKMAHLMLLGIVEDHLDTMYGPTEHPHLAIQPLDGSDAGY